MAPTAEAIAPLAVAYLERQAWYRRAVEGSPEAPVEVEAYDTLQDAEAGLGRLVLGRGGRRFQLLVGWRDPGQVAGVLQGRDAALLGAARDERTGHHVLVYDALADDELIIALLSVVTDGAESASRVRRMSTLVSHASLVFDERLLMKCYRVLEEGDRPEVEVMLGLDRVGFNAMTAPVAVWRAYGADLALVREFLPSALEGRLLALTSLRDVLAGAFESERAGGGGRDLVRDADAATASAGGDLASEMRRLGQMTASLHLALAQAFGEEPAVPSALAARVAGLSRGAGAGPQAERLAALARRIGAIGEGGAGRTMRVHGDYHLRRVLRAETGWMVAGFSDDPLCALGSPLPSLPPRWGCPLEDVADMWLSLHQVALEGLASQPPTEGEVAGALAAAWERRNQLAFLAGYVAAETTDRLLPVEMSDAEMLLEAFALERGLGYEAIPSLG